mmetsp:Transcript_160235/g.283908  ORF Transcript_160235/g.283908 Transcript_160235/m.283908 type:complete len:214 (-) Transcript_160235:76-717(-)
MRSSAMQGAMPMRVSPKLMPKATSSGAMNHKTIHDISLSEHYDPEGSKGGACNNPWLSHVMCGAPDGTCIAGSTGSSEFTYGADLSEQGMSYNVAGAAEQQGPWCPLLEHAEPDLAYMRGSSPPPSFRVGGRTVSSLEELRYEEFRAEPRRSEDCCTGRKERLCTVGNCDDVEDDRANTIEFYNGRPHGKVNKEKARPGPGLSDRLWQRLASI